MLFLFCNLTTTSIWQANLIRALNTDTSKLTEINTLDQLANIKLLVKVFSMYVSMNSLSSMNLEKWEDLSNANGLEPYIEIVAHRNSTVLVPIFYYKNDPRLVVYNSKLWVVPEILTNYYTAMIVPKTSPFIDKFNEVTDRFLETGLSEAEIRKLYNVIYVTHIGHNKNGTLPAEKATNKVIDLETIFIVFYVIMVLYLLAILVLIGEIMVYKVKKWKLKRCQRVDVLFPFLN
jgi:hypothetical protein